MRKYNLAAALLAAVLLAGCGGGGSSAGSQAPKIQFTSQVSFGDSLSDVGTYRVGAIAAAGGGEFTINGAGKNWTELMAAQEGLPAPCAAFTGGYGTTPNPTPTPGCYGYAQGGARVFSQPGIGNTGTLAGALTYPVATQIADHLAAIPGNKFSGSEIVYVLAGANDVFVEAQVAYPAYVTANVTGGMTLTAAQTAALQTALTDISGVADLLANQITTNITGKGAQYVVVVNIPDIYSTPSAAAAEAATPGSKALLDALVKTFNSELNAKLAGNANVLLVDAYTVNRDQVTNPAAYGLTNVTGTACDVTGVLAAYGGSSLFCTATTLTAGVTADTHYLFADGVHPTPYGYLLLARLVSKDMLIKGWL